MRSGIISSAVLAGLAFLQPSAANPVLVERDGNCAAQPAGSGPVASPDTPAAFSENTELWDLALSAPVPKRYQVVFTNLTASLSANQYMGLHTLTSYSTEECASLCSEASGCVAFNLYAERDPTLDPNAESCPNPPSTTNYKCTLWGAQVNAGQANNYGQWRDSFQVVISASNAYNQIPSCPGNKCGSIGNCNSNFGCYCFQSTDGVGACTQNFNCFGAQSCSSSSDCPGSGVCVVNTCCGPQGVCSPPLGQCGVQHIFSPLALSVDLTQGSAAIPAPNSDS